MKRIRKTLETQVLVERDNDGVFIVSLPGIQGAHADGTTLEVAMKNLKEVLSLLALHHGTQKFVRLVKKENALFGVLPYDVEYV
jgi:predicted RNase H-like HicB family nuclease